MFFLLKYSALSTLRDSITKVETSISTCLLVILRGLLISKDNRFNILNYTLLLDNKYYSVVLITNIFLEDNCGDFLGGL